MSPTFLDGRGEIAALMRAVDWAATPVGRPERWPQSLRTAVDLILESRFPMLLCWGREYTQFYNDPFRPILGATKHPALGKPASVTFAEAWHIVGPLFERVMSGEPVGYEDMLVPLDRSGFLEECYFTYSYSPIRDEAGEVAGVFVTCSETTGRVIGERRLRLLHDLAVHAVAHDEDELCRRAAETIRQAPADLPFGLIYLLDDTGATLHCRATTSAGGEEVSAPAQVRTDESDAPGGWPFARALEAHDIIVAPNPASPGQIAFVAPIATAPGVAAGVFIAGTSAQLPVDEPYRQFVTLVAREIGTSLANTRAIEHEKRRAEALAELDRQKTSFFSNVSHEFRTPLTLLLGPIEDAVGAGRTLSGAELAIVHRNALRLLKLVNTLLDFARLEAGRARAVFQPTDLAQMTADLASTFRSAFERAGLSLDVDCATPSGPIAVDREAWENIVLNLLSNALKFTFEGGVTVTLREQGDQIALQVADTGVGVPEQELPHLFDRFHRVHGTRARSHEGSGIGLALVHELAAMHGGTVAVVSAPGAGSTFTVTVPARRSFDAAASAEGAAARKTAAEPYLAEALRWIGAPAGESSAAMAAGIDMTGAARPVILVADDNADMREYVARLLSDRYVVERVGDGEAALSAARRMRPALVIADVMMPRLDGFGLLRALRDDPATRGIPVVMLSARAGEEASLDALAAGADDYVVKPFSARDLCARVDAQLLRAEVRAIQAAHDRRLADMFRHAPVAVALLRGPSHVVEYVNDAYAAVVGRRELVGQPLTAAITELSDQGIPGILDAVYESGQPYTANSLPLTLNRGPGGAAEQAHFTFVCQPLRDPRGAVNGIAVIAVEVTETARARHEAEAANRAKDHFLAVLGHELRNPIAPILTAASLLNLKGPPDPALQNLRQIITRQATHLTKLVEDLLDVGRIITGKLRLERAPADIVALVRQAVEASSPFIERHRHTLVVTVPEAPLSVDVDGARVVQVVCNLLNNAAKFMADGGTIELTQTADATDVFIRVRDHGIGIPADMVQRVFDRFVQAEPFSRESSEGLGIGLSLVKAIVELHGGAVSVASEGLGSGSEFTVRLPRAAAGATGVVSAAG